MSVLLRGQKDMTVMEMLPASILLVASTVHAILDTVGMELVARVRSLVIKMQYYYVLYVILQM